MTTLQGSPVAIVLAAGDASRFGGGKLFQPVQGIPIIERVVAAFLKAKRVHDLVVVHPPGEQDAYSWLRSVNVHLAENPDPSGGMITSIRVGLRSTWAHERNFLIHPGDVPFVPPEIIDRIVQTFMARSAKIVLPAYRGLGGHPGMYAAALANDFFLHGEQQGAREILVRYQSELVRLNVPEPDICFDIDTEEDLRAAANAESRWARVEGMLEAKRQSRRG